MHGQRLKILFIVKFVHQKGEMIQLAYRDGRSACIHTVSIEWSYDPESLISKLMKQWWSPILAQLTNQLARMTFIFATFRHVSQSALEYNLLQRATPRQDLPEPSVRGVALKYNIPLLLGVSRINAAYMSSVANVAEMLAGTPRFSTLLQCVNIVVSFETPLPSLQDKPSKPIHSRNDLNKFIPASNKPSSEFFQTACWMSLQDSPDVLRQSIRANRTIIKSSYKIWCWKSYITLWIYWSLAELTNNFLNT